MKNRPAGSMIKAYLALWNQLTATGVINPTTHLLDNEISAELKAEIKKNCTIQLVPPGNHRQNLAESAIQTFKCHFKAIMAGVDENFPMQLWDKLLPQTVLTLNLLRQSNIAPKVSAYQYVHGHFNYNKMPLANSLKAERGAAHGQNMQQMDGTLALQLNTINATEYMSRKHRAREYQTRYFSNTNISRNPP